MRFHTVLTSLLLGLAVLLSSCQAPPPTRYDRPPNALKFHSGGYTPGSHNGHGHGHHH
jgi:hypothetical protein